LQAILQFRADLTDFHARAHHELAAKQVMGSIFVGQLAHDAAVLAVLIPAKPSVWNRFRADVLKCPQNGVFFRDIKRFPKYLNRNQPFIWAKHLRAPIISSSRFRYLRSRIL
jgi:uncharacterized C2H2 Zn-finger protein